MEAQKKDDELRKPTVEEKKAFDKADKKLDEVKEREVSKLRENYRQSNIKVKDKKFMTISDVDPEDARWFKKFCDENFDGKQFLGIKVIRTVMERLEPFLRNVMEQINQLYIRINNIEALLKEQENTEDKLELPKTQGSKKGMGGRDK